MHITALGSDMERRPLALWINTLQHLLLIMFPQIHEDVFNRLSSRDFRQEAFVLISIPSCRDLLIKPVHLELASLQLIHNFGLIVVVPILTCVIFEIDRKGWVHQRGCKLFSCQSCESFLHKLVDNRFV